MITNKVEYLVLTLMDLATHVNEGYIITRDVADRQGIPGKYMPQIMSILAKRGWVDSARGPKGGVRLSVDPATVTVQDVIDVSNDAFLVKACVQSHFECAKKPSCPLRNVWLEAQKKVMSVMRGTTLADLVSSQLSLDQKEGSSDGKETR